MNNSKLIETINELCNQNNISVNKMLQECSLNKSIVDNLKKGSEMSVIKLQKIADYFNVSVDYLLGRTDEPTPPQTVGVTIMAFDGDGQEEIRVSREQYNKIKKLLEIMDEEN